MNCILWQENIISYKTNFIPGILFLNNFYESWVIEYVFYGTKKMNKIQRKSQINIFRNNQLTIQWEHKKYSIFYENMWANAHPNKCKYINIERSISVNCTRIKDRLNIVLIPRWILHWEGAKPAWIDLSQHPTVHPNSKIPGPQ